MAGQDDERKRRQRLRSIAIGLALGALVIIFYAASIVKVRNALHQPATDVPQAEQPKG